MFLMVIPTIDSRITFRIPISFVAIHSLFGLLMIPCLQVRTNKRDMIQLSINLNMKMMAMRLKRLPTDWTCFLFFFDEWWSSKKRCLKKKHLVNWTQCACSSHRCSSYDYLLYLQYTSCKRQTDELECRILSTGQLTSVRRWLMNCVAG